MCEHKNFHATVGVARLLDSGGFMAEIRVHCTECLTPFEFMGLPLGMDLHGAAMSADGQEARIAITPKGMKPNPIQRMAFGIEKFDG